ncbi:MAG: hypothetical protein AAGA66_08840 [Bacteroidota bacterium]
MKTVFIPLLFCGAFSVTAHNAKISTLTLRDTGVGWIIEMAFAQSSIDAEMKRQYDEESLQQLSEAAYKKTVVKYIKDHFYLKVDEIEVSLREGGIMMGDHQTDLKFVLPEIPNHPQTIEAHIPFFESSFNHTNIFRVYRGGDRMTRTFLSSENDFGFRGTFTPNGIEETASDSEISYDTQNQAGIVLGGLLVIGIVLIVGRKIKPIKENTD